MNAFRTKSSHSANDSQRFSQSAVARRREIFLKFFKPYVDSSMLPILQHITNVFIHISYIDLFMVYNAVSFSCTMGTGSFPGVKRPGRGADHPPPSKRRGHERVELYLYSPSGPQLPVIGRIFSFS
jgi:hypothetical protein